MSRGIEIERDGAGQAVRLWIGRNIPGVAPGPSDSSGSVATLRSGIPCDFCGAEIPLSRRRGSERRFCSEKCRRDSWEAKHPRVAQPEQPRLDFTPAASELAHALRGRETKAQRIVARLRQGPASTADLARITGRFSARLGELKERGLVYDRVDFKARGSEHSVYTMTREPRGY